MKRITLLGIFIAIIFTFLFTSCNQINKVKMEKTKGITKSSFGKAGGKEVFLYTLINSKGTEVKITNFGGIVTSWISADKNNKRSSIVLGYDSLSGYLAAHPYFGAIVGRYGNRIAKGKFSIGKSQSSRLALSTQLPIVFLFIIASVLITLLTHNDAFASWVNASP